LSRHQSRRGKSLKDQFIDSRLLLVMLAPALLYFLLFNYWPLYGLQIAFKTYRTSKGIFGSDWAGFKHYIRFFNSNLALTSLWNTLALSLLLIVFSTPVPILLALSLNLVNHARFKKFVQTSAYLPHFISIMIVIGIMNQMLSPVSGVVNHVISALGFKKIFFMAKPGWFRPLFIISGIWQNAGYGTIIYLAALSSVDPSLYEALEIDGGNLMHRSVYIDFPSVAPVITIVMILRIGRLLSIGFGKAWLMQNDLNITRSEILQTFVYKTGLLGGYFDYATAVGLINMIFSVILLITFNGIARRLKATALW
jgi:putative aldouronate transport system permease protein